MYFNGTVVVASFRILCLLLGKTVAQPPPNNNNVVQKMEQLKMQPLRYLINFWRSLERLLINIIVELKLRSIKNWILSVLDNENDNANSNNIIHCVESVCIWNYYGPHFPAFELNIM